MEPNKTTATAIDDDSQYVRQPLMATQSWMQHTERKLKAVRSDLDADTQFQYNSNNQLHKWFGHVHQTTVDIRSEIKYMPSHLQDVTAKVQEIDTKLEQQSSLLRQLLSELAIIRNAETQPMATQVIQDD